MRKLFISIMISATALLAACDVGDDLYIRPDTYDISVPVETSTRTFTVTSSIDWVLTVPNDDNGAEIKWVTADKTKGKAGNKETVTITVEASTVTGSRSATVLLSGDGASARITVTQSEYVPPAEGTLSGPGETNFAYADVTFAPFEGEGLEHVLFFVKENGETGEKAAGWTSGKTVFAVNITDWGKYTFVYKAGKTENGQFVPADGKQSGAITITFTEPTEAAVLKLDEYIQDTSAQLKITSEMPEGMVCQIFKDGSAVDGQVIRAETPSAIVYTEGTYSVRAILSRSGAETVVYGPASNEVEVTFTTP